MTYSNWLAKRVWWRKRAVKNEAVQDEPEQDTCTHFDKFSDAVMNKADEVFYDRHGRYPAADGSDDIKIKSICEEIARKNPNL